MERSLSLFLPVHNAQATLAADVSRMLDVLPDLTQRFDVLIIDDGSTDDTVEVADELAQRFPQVCVARHRLRSGLQAAIQTGLERTRGEIVFVHDHPGVFSMADAAALWRLRNREDIVTARQTPSAHGAAPPWFHRVIDWLRWQSVGSSNQRQRGLQMIRRQAIELSENRADGTFPLARAIAHSDAPNATQPKRPNYLSRLKQFTFGE